MANERVTRDIIVNYVENNDDKIKDTIKTIDRMVQNRQLNKYWKDQNVLIQDVTNLYAKYNRTLNKVDATELVKSFNALKAMSGIKELDMAQILPNFDKIEGKVRELAKSIDLNEAFGVDSFSSAFKVFDMLKASGVDLQEFFRHFQFDTDVDKLVSDLNNANNAVSELRAKVVQLEDELEESESGNGIRAVREECESLRWEIDYIREEAEKTFSAFLTLNNIDPGSYRVQEYFKGIKEGTLTANEAIASFKRDCENLLNGDISFDTTQLQDFSKRLDDVLKRITDVSEKIDYISSNGVRVSDFGNSGFGNFEELANVVNQIENTNANGGASAIYESLSKILTAIKEIGQCDTDNIYHIYATIRNLAQLNNLKINKASLDNLADCLERICNIGNSSALNNLSMLDLKKFNDLHISKASLNNLAEYLPQIANVDVRTLVELASIDFNKLNSLRIDKESMKNLFSFVEGLRNVTGLTDFTTANKNVEFSADASANSLKTEAELMKSIATNAEKAATAKKEFVEANKELAKATDTSTSALFKENNELGEIGNKSPIKNTLQGDKIEQATTSARELDKILEQVDVPKDSFDEVINKLRLAEIKAENIVKITKKMRIGEDGKPIESYTLKDKYGSTETYGVSSNKGKGQLLNANYVEYDIKQVGKETKELLTAQQQLTKETEKQTEAQQKKWQAFQKEQQNYISQKQEAEAIKKNKSAYQELLNTIKQYGDVSKRIAKNETLDGDLELAQKLENEIKELQKQPILSSSQIEKSEQELVSLYDELETLEKKTAKSQLNGIKSLIDGNQTNFDKLKPTQGNRSVEFEEAVQNYEKAIIALKEFYTTLDASIPLTKEQSTTLDDLSSNLKEARIEVEKFSAADRGSSQDSRMKEIDRLTKYLATNTRISKEAKKQLQDYLALLKSGDPSVNVKKIHTAWTDIAVAERQAGREGKSFFDIFKDKTLYGYANRLATYYLSLYDFIRYIRNAINAIKELDTALVDLQKTTAMNANQLEDFYYASNDVAKQLGVTTAEIINQASAWSRLGYSSKEASTEMAKLSAQFASISPGMDLDTATDGLVSTMKAFGIDVEDVERKIMDNINRIGNTAATSNDEIVDMLTRSSAAMAVANNTLEETIALETAAVEITRNAETTGTAFKTISMRIRGYDEETEELSEDLENISGEIANLTKTASKPGGISLFTDKSKTTYKSTYQILKEISEIYDELNDKQRADLLEKLAGKRGGQVVGSLLLNFEAVEKALEDMEDAAGSADDEMSIIEKSIDYKLNALKETWVGVAQNLLKREDLGKLIDNLTRLSEAIGWVTEKAGLLGTIGLGAGLFTGIKNIGRPKMFGLVLKLPKIISVL